MPCTKLTLIGRFWFPCGTEIAGVTFYCPACDAEVAEARSEQDAERRNEAALAGENVPMTAEERADVEQCERDYGIGE